MKKAGNSEREIETLNAFLLSNLKGFVAIEFPNGKPFGRLWLAENIRPGISMWIDTRTGHYEVFPQAKSHSPDDASTKRSADA